MDRAHAYKLLISEMESVSERTPTELHELSGTPIDTDVSTENGALYSISIKIKPSGEGAFLIKGSIHDNSSFKYELLEEEMVVMK